MSTPRAISVLVVGSGSIGRRHMGNLRKLGITRLAACDPHPDRLEYVRSEFQAESFSSLDQALTSFRPDAVLICSPPVCHVPQAMQALYAGAHIFIEKPLSDRLDGIDELRREAEGKKLAVQIGYNLRFHPPIEKLKQLVEERAVGKILWAQIHSGSYLPDWRPWQDYRRSYTARREMGGGILLDGSHEIDYAAWLLGAPQKLVCMAAKVSALEVNVEDCATMLWQFPGGTLADIHVDFIQRSYARSCTLAGTEGRIHWDLKANAIEIVRPDGKNEALQFDCEVNDMYLAEIAHFLECMETGGAPRFGLDQAVLALRIALAARRSAEENVWVELD
ncbi:MAG TPA: Gfo/Idh/MocA family oxidoreductase [Candidatus Binatia bacterium]|nr:Gfo/Idh/MocA family oxidoreductase [Candidatus Binatia bacterium]